MQEPTPKPYGNDAMIHAKEAVNAAKRSLIRFDLSQIDPAAQVLSARLELFVGYRHPEAATSVQVYEMMRPWSEANATWAVTGLGDAWSVAGAAGAGTDRSADSVGVFALSAGNGYKAFDATQLIQKWVRTPGANHGLQIVGGNADVRFWSSESSRDTERPKLVIEYLLSATATPSPTTVNTPVPGATLTPTPVTTATPNPTPSVLRSIYSVGWTHAFDAFTYADCIEAGPIKSNPDNTQVMLVWRGIPIEASLRFNYAGNNRNRHSVLVNGTIIGQLPGDNWSSSCSGGTPAEISFDPALVRSGANTISIVDDGGYESSSWSLQRPRIRVSGNVEAAQLISVTLSSSFDGTAQRSMIQTPVGYTPESGPRPLVIALHGWGARDFNAVLWPGLAQAASDQGFILVAPDVRGQSEHTASGRVQRDVLDILNYVINAPEYNVDVNRVYLVGKSMGGMFASTIAAKYPDRFAGLVTIMGPSDLTQWYWEVETWRKNVIANEVGGLPQNVPFGYQRRSASVMPHNLRHIPTLIIHGRDDTLVPFSHGENLYRVLEPYGKVTLQPFDGGHYDEHPAWGSAQILAWLSPHVRVQQPRVVTVRTDTPASYYWLNIAYVAADHWTWVDASYDPHSQVITADVFDERTTPLSVDVSFDLIQMGLPTNTNYTVEDTNLVTGAFQQHTVAATSKLTLNVLGDRHKLVAYPRPAAAPMQAILRQGENGYVGAQDTYIRQDTATTNYSADTSLVLNHSNSRVPLLRFDLGSVPPGVVIKSAQLGIYASSKWSSEHSIKASVFRLLSPWSADQATWQMRQDGAAWAEPGASSAGQDYGPLAPSPRQITAIGAWYRFNATDMVNQWLSDPSSNHGVVLRTTEGLGTFNFSASESPSNRPELSIIYAYPTATPWPTATPSPTATATRQVYRAMLPAILRR
jgi:pimeloyl-ACP methyl ester carboxylesterase